MTWLKRKRELTPLDALVAFIAVTSAVMLAQLLASQFSAGSALAVSVVACSAGVAFVVRLQGPPSVRLLAGLLAAGAIVLVPRWAPFLYVEGGQDQGVYVAMSSHFERTGGVGIVDAVRERLPAEERPSYDRLNNTYDAAAAAEAPGRSEGEHQPGIFIEDLTRSAYVFQFYPLHPLWMAVAAEVLGEPNRVYSLVFFSLLNVLMISLLAYELSGRRPAAALLAAAFLAVNPMHVFFSCFPVSENLILFFLASALYFLLRYAKASGEPDTVALVLSAASWGCLFFTHISGFLYLPLVIVAALAAIVASELPARRVHLAAYGASVLALYFLSVWYGLIWAYPYSHVVYLGIFGPGLGPVFMEYWWAFGTAAMIVVAFAAHVAWRHRQAIRDLWTRWRIGHAAALIVLAILLASAANAALEGYRLGFTDAYGAGGLLERDVSQYGFAEAGQNRARILAAHAGSGAWAITHTSIGALVIYVTPFVLLFVAGMLAAAWRRLPVEELLLLLFVGLLLMLRTGLTGYSPFTLYYYFGRYLAVELVPLLLLLAAVWMHREWQSGIRWRRGVAAALAALALTWEGAALARQYPGGEMDRLDASLRPLISQIDDDELLLVAAGDYSGLRTALGFYYGKKTAAVDPARVDEEVQRYLRWWPTVYVLTQDAQPAGTAYRDSVTLVRDSYSRGDALDVLPMDSNSSTLAFDLYRASRDTP